MALPVSRSGLAAMTPGNAPKVPQRPGYLVHMQLGKRGPEPVEAKLSLIAT